MTCRNCKTAGVLVKALCLRCYRYEVRHNTLPPPERLRAEVPMRSAKTQLSAEDLARVEKRARRAGMPVAAWIRAAVLRALEAKC